MKGSEFMSSLRVKAHEIIDNISEKRINEVIEYLEYLKIKEEAEATNEILNDKVFMESIKKGMLEAGNGDLIGMESVIEDV